MNINQNKHNSIQHLIESNFVLGLRAVFMNDPMFRYDTDEKKTGILISTAYPSKECEFKVPQIVLNDCSYSMNVNTLYDNYAEDIIEYDENGRGRTIGKRYATPVSYSASIICFANRNNVVKELANRIVDTIAIEAKDLFSHSLNLNINSVTKGSSGVYNNIGTNTYQCSISISGVVNWVGNVTNKYALYLNNIDVITNSYKNEKDYINSLNPNVFDDGDELY